MQEKRAEIVRQKKAAQDRQDGNITETPQSVLPVENETASSG